MFNRAVRGRALAVGVALMVVGALGVPAANAAISAGASFNCDADQHCVTGGATSANAGPGAQVDVQVVPMNNGVAVAICTGTGNGALLIQITCTHGAISKTMSFPGTAGAVPLQTTLARLERLPVCWNVIGFFPVVTGAEHKVGTSDCAQLAL